MNISGLAKLTLLDFPGKTACTVFFYGCNFRCPFCHNASLVTSASAPEYMGEDEFFEFLGKRRGKLDGVCISGGEPLLRQDIGGFIRRIKDMGFAVKLDTNGSFPDRLISLVRENLLDYVAMDIKNSPAKYMLTTGLDSGDISEINKSVEFLKTNAVPYEFRTTLVKNFHTADDIALMGEWIRGADRWFLQAFVDSGDIISANLTGFSIDEYSAFLDIARRFMPNAQLRGV